MNRIAAARIANRVVSAIMHGSPSGSAPSEFAQDLPGPAVPGEHPRDFSAGGCDWNGCGRRGPADLADHGVVPRNPFER